MEYLLYGFAQESAVIGAQVQEDAVSNRGIQAAVWSDEKIRIASRGAVFGGGGSPPHLNLE